MATHCSVPAWRIPGTGEPGGPPSMGSHRVGHEWSDLAAAAYIYIYTPKVVEWKNMVGKWFLTLKNNFLLPRVLITFVMLGVSDCGNQIIGIVVLKKKKKDWKGRFVS